MRGPLTLVDPPQFALSFVPVQPPPECDRDVDCAMGERCELGFCQPDTPCRITADCPTGQVCVDGFCRIPVDCLTDADCAAGETCNERGTCVAGP